MRRADRLFEIIKVLRRARHPLTADAIAAALETSRRTIYRDIATLMAQRVPIRGEAGVGYVLDRGFDLPPLMLTSDELEALMLGTQWVRVHGDPALARAAADIVAKVAAIVPDSLRDLIDDPIVATPPRRDALPTGGVDVARLRLWSLQGRKLAIRYGDEKGEKTERTVWPFLVGYRDALRMLVAWCELRRDFRLFRVDRIERAEFLEERYPEPRAVLRRRWLATRESPMTANSTRAM